MPRNFTMLHRSGGLLRRLGVPVLASLTLLTSSALAPSHAHATVPGLMAIEGSLLASAAAPAADGLYSVTFAVFKDQIGGNPLWTEGPVSISVKNGAFQYMLGSKTPLSAAVLSGLPTAFLSMQIAADAELPRQALVSVAYALRAAVAEGLECSGCVGASALDPQALAAYVKTTDLGAYAKSASLAKVATSGAFADLTGGPDLSAYAKTSGLAKVATSGAFADLTGGPDLSAYAKSTDLAGYVKAASLAKVAGSGAYADLSGLPVQPVLGKTCGTGLVMNGINADGSYACIASAIAADMIDEISNGLIYNQFVDSTAGTGTIKIPDGLGAGVTDTLTFPDIGLAQKIWVNMTVANSDLSGVRVELYGPGISTPYVLYNGGKTGTTLTTNFNSDTAIVSGDLNGDWVGKNIKGAWSLTVKDLKAGGGSGGFDGTFTWSLNIQTLSNKKIQIKGNLLVDSSIKIGDDSAACDLTKEGTIRYSGAVPQICQNGSWVGLQTNLCPGPEIQGICTAPTGCGNCNFQNSANYCGSKKADICSDSQTYVLNYTHMLVSNALWTNSFADNDSGQWSEVNNGTGDDHSNGSGWTAQCCYNFTPPRPTDQYIGGVRIVYTHDTNTVYFRQAATFCAGMKADLCSKTEYQILRTAGKLPNAGWGYWASDHSDNDDTSYEKGIGPVSDNPTLGEHWSFMCCASQRKTFECTAPGAKEYGGVCTTKVENSTLTDWVTASQACGNLNSRLCSISESAVLRSLNVLTATSNWTASYSDNDGGNAAPGVGGAGDNHPPNSQYGYACCVY